MIALKRYISLQNFRIWDHKNFVERVTGQTWAFFVDDRFKYFCSILKQDIWLLIQISVNFIHIGPFVYN